MFSGGANAMGDAVLSGDSLFGKELAGGRGGACYGGALNTWLRPGRIMLDTGFVPECSNAMI